MEETWLVNSYQSYPELLNLEGKMMTSENVKAQVGYIL